MTGRFLVVRYHRVGYLGSAHVTGSVSIEQQAEHCIGLMHNLGIHRAHIIGHSSGANIAIQFALAAPRAVHSLALLEPALYDVPSANGPARAYVAAALKRYGDGDKAGAVETFLRGVGGPDYLAPLEQALPGALREAVADADTFFGRATGAPAMAVHCRRCGPYHAAGTRRNWGEERPGVADLARATGVATDVVTQCRAFRTPQRDTSAACAESQCYGFGPG